MNRDSRRRQPDAAPGPARDRDAGDDQPTRVALVDPTTGEVIGTDLDDENGGFSIAEGATVLARPFESPRRSSAEFVPPCGRRSTTESTLSWSEGNGRRLGGALGDLCRRLAARGSRKRPALLLLACAVTALGTAAMLAFGGPPARGGARLPLAKNSSPAPPDQVIRADAGPPPPLIAPTDRVRLRDAADALIGGRLDEATEIYRQLRDRNPRNRSFGLAADILSRSRERRPR